MLELSKQMSEGLEHSLEGKTVTEVYCLSDTYHESSDKSGFTALVLEFEDGTFVLFPPVYPSMYRFEAENLDEIFEHLENLKNDPDVNFVPESTNFDLE